MALTWPIWISHHAPKYGVAFGLYKHAWETWRCAEQRERTRKANATRFRQALMPEWSMGIFWWVVYSGATSLMFYSSNSKARFFLKLYLKKTARSWTIGNDALGVCVQLVGLGFQRSSHCWILKCLENALTASRSLISPCNVTGWWFERSAHLKPSLKYVKNLHCAERPI